MKQLIAFFKRWLNGKVESAIRILQTLQSQLKQEDPSPTPQPKSQPLNNQSEHLTELDFLLNFHRFSEPNPRLPVLTELEKRSYHRRLYRLKI